MSWSRTTTVWSARIAASAAIVVPAASAATAGTGGSALSGRPLFQLPFPCDEIWNGATYENHAGFGNDHALDLNQGGGFDDHGAEVLAGYGGMVEYRVESDGDHVLEIHHGGNWSTEYRHLRDFAVPDRAADRIQLHLQRAGILPELPAGVPERPARSAPAGITPDAARPVR